VVELWKPVTSFSGPDLSKYANAKEMEARYQETLKETQLEHLERLKKAIKKILPRLEYVRYAHSEYKSEIKRLKLEQKKNSKKNTRSRSKS
jgi:hypothetical protein